MAKFSSRRVYRNLLLAVLTTSSMLGGTAQSGDEEDRADHASDSRIVKGLAIAPVPLNLRRKNVALVGLGSYLVNAGGACNDCHTWPNYAPGGDPFAGEPEKINTPVYLAGGRPFGPTLKSENITPDADGRPAGLTLTEFIKFLRTGRDPHDPTKIVQVMPWPVYGKLTDHDLKAIYEYLRAIPSLPDNF